METAVEQIRRQAREEGIGHKAERDRLNQQVRELEAAHKAALEVSEIHGEERARVEALLDDLLSACDDHRNGPGRRADPTRPAALQSCSSGEEGAREWQLKR